MKNLLSAKGAKKREDKPKNSFMETLNKSFDKLRTNGKLVISFVVSLSNHERNPHLFSVSLNTLNSGLRRNDGSTIFLGWLISLRPSPGDCG